MHDKRNQNGENEEYSVLINQLYYDHIADYEEEVFEEQQEEQEENDFEKGSRPEDDKVRYG